jgi:long-chain acyl-CoA synthetase
VKNLLVPTSGHNVAPEPLEERVLQHVPGVEQAVVIGHARPWLAVIVTGNVEPSALDAALEKVNEGLPHYRRLRKAFVAKEKLTPENGLLTANQKLRRSAIERHFAKEIDALYG